MVYAEHRISERRFAINEFQFLMHIIERFTIPIKVEARCRLRKILFPVLHHIVPAATTTKDKGIIVVFVLVLNVHLRRNKGTVGVDIIVLSVSIIVVVIMIQHFERIGDEIWQ